MTVTVAELDGLTEKLRELKEEKARQEEVVSGLSKEISALEIKAADFLKELGRDNYKSPHGTVYLTQTWTVKMPTEPKDKDALFNWMKEREIFEHYATVNYRSLNRLYKTLFEEAKERGEMDFEIPGVGAPSVFEKARFV